jgi:protein HOOK3
MAQYFADVLQCPSGTLDVPDLQAISKDHDVPATLIMCRMTIAIGVQCERNKEFIDKIQGLSETDQHCLMKAIEQVRLCATCIRVQVGLVSAQSSVRLGHGEDIATSWSSRRGRS